MFITSLICTPNSPSMENRRKRSSSGEIFSFPNTPNKEQDSDFEFGCFTPDSPSQDPYRTSPADHLFFNGRLLPHSFPIQPATTTTMVAVDQISPRGTSRTSSINSKDSLMSSRSNSTNSRSSCSSARTSSSENSERRRFLHHYKASKMVSAQMYGDSQKWQYITAMPVLKREVSRRKNGSLRTKKQSDHQEMMSRTKGRTPSGSCLRVLRLFLLICRECHALEPSKKQDFVEPNLCVVR